jgi:xylulose-5-phosphate/fructose-6-phosphate phosphoketolase
MADSPADVPPPNHRNIHVAAIKEEGTITTPFDMAVLTDLDRFHLAADALARLPQLGTRGEAMRRELGAKLAAHRTYIRDHGEDMPDIRNWRWPN